MCYAVLWRLRWLLPSFDLRMKRRAQSLCNRGSPRTANGAGCCAHPTCEWSWLLASSDLRMKLAVALIRPAPTGRPQASKELEQPSS